jgi:hypothetical protein
MDLDAEMVAISETASRKHGIRLEAITGDYLELPMDQTYDCAVLNPPYIRQEWLDKKRHYQEVFKRRYEVSVPGTSNLYVYFLVKVLMDLKPGGRFSCIVYDSWQSTRYGRWLAEFLRSRCRSLHVETKPGQPFHGRLIDATVVYGDKKEIRGESVLKVSDATVSSETSMRVGDLTTRAQARQKTLWDPSETTTRCLHSPSSSGPSSSSQNAAREESPGGPLSGVCGFAPISTVFPSNRRGLRLKQADFFLCDLSKCAGPVAELATPFFKKVSHVKGFHVPEDHPGAALLLTPTGEMADTKEALIAELERRLETAKRHPERNVSILTWYRERPESWHLHREAPYAPIVFNYYLRNRPRHIFNPRHAYSDNFYGLPVENGVSPLAWLAALNTTAVSAEVMARSRNQGDGLAKIQLFEYREVNVPDLTVCSKTERAAFESLGLDMVERPHLAAETISRADRLLSAVFSDPRLSPDCVAEAFEESDLRARRPKETSFADEGLA